jgi:hypothetical protein
MTHFAASNAVKLAIYKRITACWIIWKSQKASYVHLALKQSEETKTKKEDRQLLFDSAFQLKKLTIKSNDLILLSNLDSSSKC